MTSPLPFSADAILATETIEMKARVTSSPASMQILDAGRQRVGRAGGLSLSRGLTRLVEYVILD